MWWTQPHIYDMPWKNERLWNLQDCYSVFWSKLTFVSRLPKPNDSNDYCNRLIYLSCNNYLIFLVSLTSFKERGLHLPFTRKRRWAFWLFFYLTMKKFVFNVSLNNWVPAQIMLLFHVESLPATTSFMISIS